MKLPIHLEVKAQVLAKGMSLTHGGTQKSWLKKCREVIVGGVWLCDGKIVGHGKTIDITAAMINKNLIWRTHAFRDEEVRTQPVVGVPGSTLTAVYKESR